MQLMLNGALRITINDWSIAIHLTTTKALLAIFITDRVCIMLLVGVRDKGIDGYGRWSICTHMANCPFLLLYNMCQGISTHHIVY